MAGRGSEPAHADTIANDMKTALHHPDLMIRLFFSCTMLWSHILRMMADGEAQIGTVKLTGG